MVWRPGKHLQLSATVAVLEITARHCLNPAMKQPMELWTVLKTSDLCTPEGLLWREPGVGGGVSVGDLSL